MKYTIALLGILLWALQADCSIQAQETTATLAEGYVTVTIAASPNGTSYAITPFSAPLHTAVSIAGQASGRLTGVAASALSNSGANWDAGTLATAALPYFVKITSGAAAGRMFYITANSSTALTVNTQGLNLTALGISTGPESDSYEIVPGDTLLGLLGTPADGITGGTASQFSASQVDKVLLNDSTGSSQFYYYDTSVSQWRRLGSGANQGNVVISPLAGMVYYRISGAPLVYTFMGRVPASDLNRQVSASGTVALAVYFPQDNTLNGLGLHQIIGWRKVGDVGVVVNTADKVILREANGALTSFYHDGISWKRVGSAANQNNQVLPAGGAIMCTRFGSIGQSHAWTQILPYNLN